jgi:hypothetical protein
MRRSRNRTKKLYEYNLALTGDRLRLAEEQQRKTESPFEAIMNPSAARLSPEQLQAALAVGIAAACKQRAAEASTPKVAAQRAQPGSRMLRVMFWIVIALSAGAIAASLAIR